MRPVLRAALLVAVAGSALLAGAVAAPPAQAATPCWKTLLNDWYDGRIDHTYPVHCYRETLKHLPADVQTYSSAHDDISRALQAAIAQEKKSHKPVGANTLVPPQKGSGGAGTGSGGIGPHDPGTGGTGFGGTGGTGTTSSGSPGNKGSGGLAGEVPSSSPSSVPTPLLVLGGLAVLLIAAGGAGLVAKRIQSRRAGI